MVVVGAEYFNEVYGEPLLGYSKGADFATENDFYTDYGFGEAYKGNEIDAQIDTINDGIIDPKLLPFPMRIRYHIREFCYSTSAHGIPWILRARNLMWRLLWSTLYIFCFSMFWYQATNVIKKFQRNEKIVDIELKFETAPFPAVTLCNLNPYKQSYSTSNELVQKTMGAFSDAMGSAAEKKSHHERKKRSGDGLHGGAMIFELAESICACDETKECTPDTKRIPVEGEGTCLCAFDRHSEEAWPCEFTQTWYEAKCRKCDAHMVCKEQTESDEFDEYCYCTQYHARAFCIAHPRGAAWLKLWEYFGGAIPTEDPNFLEAMGFGDMTDEIAIVTKAKENLVFAMASIDMESRRKMSSQLDEFVHKCSFNGKQCDIEKDFLFISDPTYGNCYTYNFRADENLTSSRAGPMYGLRVLLYVNASEYMATTEAAGVRLTIHTKQQYPFPDTFGYSAPTGYISSFGVRLRMIDRLPKPFGNCIPDGMTDDYIYRGYGYSTEGCYRSCFQNMVTMDCGCGDPRFPVVTGYQHCLASDPTARKCLDRATKELGGMHGQYRCICRQPCKQSSFSVSYSASKWPSKSLKMKLDACIDDWDATECVEHYKENGAMVEVFYEQLNYESLRESQAYGWVNVLADFGGQLGLWLGMSVITCFEALMLVWDLIWLTSRHHYKEYKLKKLQEMKAKGLI